MTDLEQVTTRTGSDKGLGIQCSLAAQTIPPRFRSPHGPLTSEMSEHKKQHLMIFMRALLTTTIRQCQERAWNTKLATVGLYDPVMRLMTSSNAQKCSQLLINEIHSP